MDYWTRKEIERKVKRYIRKMKNVGIGVGLFYLMGVLARASEDAEEQNRIRKEQFERERFEKDLDEIKDLVRFISSVFTSQ